MQTDVQGDATRASLNWFVIVLTGITALVEGFDLQLISYIAPSVSKEWGLPLGAFGPIFAMGAVGMLVGSMMIAPLADKFGRKWIVVVATACYGLATFFSIYVQNVPEFLLARFVVGVGVGCALPNAIALCAEFNPARRRTFVVAILLGFLGIGSALAGILAAQLIPLYGWRFVLLVGAGATLFLVPILALWLPESRYFLTRERKAELEKKAAIPFIELFRAGRARVTLCLWVVFFMSLMDLYLLTNWLPSTVEAQGLPLHFAVLMGSLFQTAGIGGSLVLAPLVDRFGASGVMTASYGGAAICAAALGYVSDSMLWTGLLVFGAGFFVVGSQALANGIATKFYPTAIRATGIGWALGLGRVGAIVGPLFGGALLQMQYPASTLFLFAAMPPLIAAVAFFLIGKRTESDIAASEN